MNSNDAMSLQTDDHEATIFHQFQLKLIKIRIQRTCGDPKVELKREF